MNTATHSLEINALESLTAKAPKHVVNAIHGASQKSGVDFAYLVQQAKAESSFNPTIKAKTSSATGLYQFIDSTWLQMIDRYGESYGLETEGKSKQEILDMRKDPKASSFMAAAFASENEKTLNENWGGKVGATELYFAHFLGAGGASSFLKARDENPFQTAADVFPQAARANRNVFFDPETGKPRTLEQVYQFFDKKFKVNNDIQIAENRPKENPAYNSIVRTLSDHIISKRSQAMRMAAVETIQSHSYGQISMNPITGLNSNSNKREPFFNMIVQPIDIMLLAQDGDKRTNLL
ncbi:MAG: transglycosylase SLT domain-containing protein [Alphaproteobacteria bacterium]|nr:transglycosylase SLT domain-containing protein [Alphaproteobacteria bacterium]